MTNRTHQDVIDEHVTETEKQFGEKILKIHVDYNPACDPEELAESLRHTRAVEHLHRQIDPLTLALAKVDRYEALIGKLRKFGTAHVNDWLAMSDSEAKLRHEIFSMTEMATFGDPGHDIEFARARGFHFNA